MRKSAAIPTALVAAVILSLLGAYTYTKWKYPYGRTHCCLKHFSLAFRIYASDREGRFPAGESTPEASLSLLHKGDLLSSSILAGMTASRKKAMEVLDRGELLGPDTCSWLMSKG
jgi:hypothetical protein